MFKKERGITLVALVVTIVVLLILAGVSISMVLGNNGLVTKAKETQAAQDKAYAEDTIESALKSVQIEVLSNSLPEGKTANIDYVCEVLNGKNNSSPAFSKKTEADASTHLGVITYTAKDGKTYDITVDMANYIVK